MAGRMQTPRGTRDFMPEDMDKRQHVFGIVRRTFESYGFRPMETPAFESWEVLGSKGGGGEAIRDEVYAFKDKSGRELGLRFDLTVPVSRVIASNPQLPRPFKRYQIGRVWRYDRPQAGRYREFWQADIDTFGPSTVQADAECMACLCDCLKSLGFKDFRVRLNSRKLLAAMVEAVGIDKKKAPSVFRGLDKLEKQGSSAVEKELKKAGIKPKQLESLMNMISIKGNPEEVIEQAGKLLEGFISAKEALDELESIAKLSKPYGFEGNLNMDLSLVRGLDYYTGPIYEFNINSKTRVGSVGGGGRYDSLIELYAGQYTPATGGSLGIERIIEIMEAEGMFKGMKAGKAVFITTVGEVSGLPREAIKVAGHLREEGISASTELMGRNLKQSIEYASKAGFGYLIVIGEKEMKGGKLTFKDLDKREQKSLGIKDIIKALKNES